MWIIFIRKFNRILKNYNNATRMHNAEKIESSTILRFQNLPKFIKSQAKLANNRMLVERILLIGINSIKFVHPIIQYQIKLFIRVEKYPTHWFALDEICSDPVAV